MSKLARSQCLENPQEVPVAKIVNDAIKKINKSKTYRQYVNSGYEGVINSVIEKESLNQMNNVYSNMFYHPDKLLKLGDIVHKNKPNISFEFKVTFGWTSVKRNGKTYKEIVWSQGTKQEGKRNFVFIKCLPDGDKIKLDAIYIGYNMPYDYFARKCKNGMRISEKMVVESCIRIW